MKKLILIILTGLLIYGCGGKSGEQKPEEQKDQFSFDTTDIKAKPVENPGQSFYLRYKLEKGTTYRFRLTVMSKDDQTITSKDTTMSQGADQTMIYNLKFTPTSVDADSTLEMETVITSIKIDGTYGEEPVHYQSGVTKDSADISKYAQYESLVQNPFNIRVTKIGELLDVFRTDGIVNKLLDIKGYADSLKSEEKATLKNNIADGVIKPMISQVFRKLPREKMGADSSWKVDQPATQLMVFQAHNTSIFRIKGLEKLEDDLIADIDAGLETKFTGEKKLSDRGINYEFKDPVTTGGGKIYFNVSRGLVQKTKLSTSVSLAFNLESRGEKGSKKELISNTNILEFIP
ncbi:MAG TPA: DUF6263 family protein [Ignavibacteriaceae bacterium]|nr:DUF6263 family protein [Ignavibacteriaceae bacterium]